MKKLTPRFISKFRKQWNQNLRVREQNPVNSEYTRRQKAAYRNARRAKKANARSAYFQSVQENAVRGRQGFLRAMRWESIRQAAPATRRFFLQLRVSRFAFRALFAIAAASLVCNVLMYSRWSLSRPLVTIGHHVITKGEYLARLDTAAGKPVLSNLVFDELVRQAADQAHLTPTEQDIDRRLAERRRQMPGSIPAEDTPELRSHVGKILALENLRVQGMTATDAEITAYYAAHKMEFTRPPQAQVSLVVTQNSADAAEASRLLAEEMPEDAIAAHSGLRVDGVNGFQVNMNALPPGVHAQLSQIVMGMKNGEMRTVHLGNIFLIFKMKSHTAGSTQPLSEVREQIAREVKLQKAPTDQQKLEALYQANKPDFDITKYGEYFSDIDSTPRPARPDNRAKTASLTH